MYDVLKQRRTKMKYLPVIALSLLTGCASSVVTSTPRTVVLKGANSSNTAQTQVMADVECQKHNRWAVHIPDSQRDGIATYECVE